MNRRSDTLLVLLFVISGCAINNSTGGYVTGLPLLVDVMKGIQAAGEIQKRCENGFYHSVMERVEDGMSGIPNKTYRFEKRCMSLREVHEEINQGARSQ